MHPYTAQENEWLSSQPDSRPQQTIRPLEMPTAVVDDAAIRMHMRRGERMRAQEVKRCFIALFRLPGTLLRTLGHFLKPSVAPHI